MPELLDLQQLRSDPAVHDELLFEAPKAVADETAALVRERMEGAVALRVPLTVDVGVGENWKEAKS